MMGKARGEERPYIIQQVDASIDQVNVEISEHHTTHIISNRSWCTEQNVGQLERRRGNCTQTEMRMLRWARGKTRLDDVRNVDIWKDAHMYSMTEFLNEKRLRWFRHEQRRNKDEATINILQMT